ncbi:unnamed protein product [Phytophthora fragariaefolia]|uniref:Unnamed protein product n=1 Tax=Phytophthora fragariaefolia TaxID=1490495 RepID=A0A9W6YD17_9STRA|nr:unnamed protein product [Phytophthora fragariaefolia]
MTHAYVSSWHILPNPGPFLHINRLFLVALTWFRLIFLFDFELFEWDIEFWHLYPFFTPTIQYVFTAQPTFTTTWLDADVSGLTRREGGMALPSLWAELLAMAMATVSDWAIHGTTCVHVIGDILHPLTTTETAPRVEITPGYTDQPIREVGMNVMMWYAGATMIQSSGGSLPPITHRCILTELHITAGTTLSVALTGLDDTWRPPEPTEFQLTADPVDHPYLIAIQPERAQQMTHTLTIIPSSSDPGTSVAVGSITESIGLPLAKQTELAATPGHLQTPYCRVGSQRKSPFRIETSPTNNTLPSPKGRLSFVGIKSEDQIRSLTPGWTMPLCTVG